MGQPGDNTEDLTELRKLHPAERDLSPEEREVSTRRWGNLMMYGGLALGVTVAVTAHALSLFAHPNTWPHEASQLALVGTIGLIALAAAGVAVGGVERVNRSLRSCQRRIVFQAEQDRRQAEEDRKLLATMARTLDVFAEHMPLAFEQADWRGYNSAVREGWGGQRTGTDYANAPMSRNGRPYGLIRGDNN